MKKNIIISIIIGIAVVAGVTQLSSKKAPTSETANKDATSSVEIKDGIQYVTINAKGGYNPKSSLIKPDIPTKLVMKTDGTYDCSASLSIRSIGFQKILKPTGEEIIDIGSLKTGENVRGVCGMGMYNFQVQAS